MDDPIIVGLLMGLMDDKPSKGVPPSTTTFLFFWVIVTTIIVGGTALLAYFGG